MEGLLGDELHAFLAALREPATGLRVNTLRLAPEELRGIVPFALTELPFPPEGFVLDPSDRPGRHPCHDAGLYYLQDPGAMAVGAMVGARPAELVLDLAAAPGGKATHLAACMAGEGVLVANDVHPGRARELAGNLERLGVRNAVVTAESPERLANRLGDVFDRVLVDAPCSGESMFHKSAAAVADWSPAAVTGCARRQVEVLEQAARLVRPGGLLVYSTCTFSPEENEEAIARFLLAREGFSMAPLDAPPGAMPGRPGWVEEPLRRDDLGLATRLWPHRVPGAGHFVAGLRREAGPETPRPSRERGARSGADGGAPREAAEAWRDFMSRHLPSARIAEASRLVSVGEGLYGVPAGAPDLEGLRVLVPGLWLGRFRKGRFEPSHTLAMALQRHEIAGGLDLHAESPEIAAYLRGETLSSTGPDGWLVVTMAGFPIGWGKRVGGVVKNHYPRGLRRR